VELAVFEISLRIASVLGAALAIFLPLFLVVIFKSLRNKETYLISSNWKISRRIFYALALFSFIDFIFLLAFLSKNDGVAGLLVVIAFAIVALYWVFGLTCWILSQQRSTEN
jgi:hypothetical protein